MHMVQILKVQKSDTGNRQFPPHSCSPVTQWPSPETTTVTVGSTPKKLLILPVFHQQNTGVSYDSMCNS